MDFIKLLDVANPKKIKDTINLLIENYEDFGDTVQAIADKAAEDSAAALLAGNEAKQIAQNSATTLLQSITQQNNIISQNFEEQDEIIAQNKAEQDATIEAAFEAQDAKLNAQDEEIAQNTTTSDQAKQIAEEALAMIEQADARSQAATETAEDALDLANESIETSELAMNVATEAKSTVDQAISTGVFGTFVHNTAGISLLHAYMTDNLNQENTDENFYMATPKLVRDALTDYYTKDEAAAKTDIPTEYLAEARTGYYFGSTKTYGGIKVTNNTNKSYGVYFDPDDFKESVSGSISGTGYDYRLFALKDVVRTTNIDQEIAGIKNYIGGLQKNSVDVATVNDIPQAVTVTLTETQNFNDIVISNEQFELLLSNPENYLIIETSNGSLTISLKYRRSQYFTMTSGNVLQEALIFNCVNSTSFAPYAERIDSMTLIRQIQNGETNIVVQDDTLDFTTFVPKTRTINGKSLSNDIILTATDVNALPDTTEIPTTTSQLTNDSNFVSDSAYVHTDNNYTTAEKNKLAGIETGAEVNTVTSVAGKTGTVVLTATDVGALPDSTFVSTININGQPQSTINFDSDPQTQIDELNENKYNWATIDKYNRLLNINKDGYGFSMAYYNNTIVNASDMISMFAVTSKSASDTSGFIALRVHYNDGSYKQNNIILTKNGIEINGNITGSNNIITHGSNSNGDYIQFYNGTQICIGTVTSEGTKTYASPFTAKPVIVCGIINSSSSSQISYRTMSAYNITSTNFHAQLTGSTSKTYIAIGKYK